MKLTIHVTLSLSTSYKTNGEKISSTSVEKVIILVADLNPQNLVKHSKWKVSESKEVIKKGV